MASHPICFPNISLHILVLIIISLPYAFTETSVSDNSSTIPDIVECGMWLLPLAPCAPYVQGSVSSPVQICCDNLIKLYDQESSCLCVFLNDTDPMSFGINRTLALQLPLACKLAINNSICPGLVPDVPESQVAHGTRENSSSNAVSPMAVMPPRLPPFEFGLGRNAGGKVKVEGNLLGLVPMVLIIEVFIWF